MLVIAYGTSPRDTVLWRHLVAANPDVDLVVPVRTSSWTAQDWGLDAATARRVHPVRRRSLGSDTSVVLSGLSDVLRDVKPDLVHVDDEPWSLTSQWLARSRTATVVHAAESVVNDAAWPYRLRRVGLRRTLGGLAGFCAWGHTSLAAFRAAGLPIDTPAAILPSKPPSPSVFHAVAPREPDGVLRVGYVGRLIKPKGIDVAIDAMARVALNGGVCHLDIVGSGPEQVRLQEHARSVGAPVTFHGAVNDEVAIADFMARMDVIVVPSRGARNWQEQWCRSALEGLMIGRPVLASNSGELPWSVGVPEWIFEEDDSSQLAAKLLEIAEPGTVAQAHARALAAAREVSLDAYGEKLEDLWSSALTEAGTRGRARWIRQT